MLNKKAVIAKSLSLIFQGIKDLQTIFDNRRKFTIDGRLVGDIGEMIAEMVYDIKVDEKSQPGHDGVTSGGRLVQVKVTFQNHLTFKGGYDLYLGLKLLENGEFEEIFNGPGKIIEDRYKHRKDIGNKLLSFPINELKKLQQTVPILHKVPLRK